MEISNDLLLLDTGITVFSIIFALISWKFYSSEKIKNKYLESALKHNEELADAYKFKYYEACAEISKLEFLIKTNEIK